MAWKRRCSDCGVESLEFLKPTECSQCGSEDIQAHALYTAPPAPSSEAIKGLTAPASGYCTHCDEEEGCDCGFSDEFANAVALEVLCRVFDDGADEGITEWYEWWAENRANWFWWGRALGAFIRRRMDRLAAPAGGEREEACGCIEFDDDSRWTLGSSFAGGAHSNSAIIDGRMVPGFISLRIADDRGAVEHIFLRAPSPESTTNAPLSQALAELREAAGDLPESIYEDVMAERNGPNPGTSKPHPDSHLWDSGAVIRSPSTEGGDPTDGQVSGTSTDPEADVATGESVDAEPASDQSEHRQVSDSGSAGSPTPEPEDER